MTELLLLFSVIVSGPVEHAVSLKQVLQHMEACPDLAHYGLCGIRKWSSRALTGQEVMMSHTLKSSQGQQSVFFLYFFVFLAAEKLLF